MKKAQRQDKDRRSQLYYAAGQVQNSRTYTDGDFIFTEHNLDTKEDEREEEKRSSLALRDDRVPDETTGPSKSKDGKKEDIKAKSRSGSKRRNSQHYESQKMDVNEAPQRITTLLNCCLDENFIEQDEQ